MEETSTQEIEAVEAGLRQALADIAERDGVLTAEAVVEAAASEESPLHAYFVWDDTLAAREYRLFQARVLIREIKIKVERTPDRVVPVKAHRRSRPGDVPAVVRPVPADGFKHIMELQARRELQVLRNRYGMLMDFDALLREELARVQPEEALGREGVAAV